MTISLIVAMDQNQVIGDQGKLPWHIPEDLQYFKDTTMEHTVIMGRKTFDSIGKPLHNRLNVVLTKENRVIQDYVVTLNSVEDTFKWMEEHFTEDAEFFIIGGKEIYQQFYPHADRLYVTHIDHEFQGDTQWNEFDWADWRLVSSTQGATEGKYPYDFWFAVYERVHSKP